MSESSERQVLGSIFFGRDEKLKAKLLATIQADVFTSRSRSMLLENADGSNHEMAIDRIRETHGEHAAKEAHIEIMFCHEGWISDAETDRARKEVMSAHLDRKKVEIGTKLAKGMSADLAFAELRDLSRADALFDRPPPKSVGELASEEMFRQESIGAGAGSRCMPIDIPPFDVNGGLYPGDLWTIAAPQGCGKTMIALQAMLRASDRGARCLFLSLEMDQAGLVRRLMAGGDARRLRAGLPPSDPLWERIERRSSMLRGMDLSIAFAGGYSVDQLETEVRQHALGGQVDVVAIDFFQLIRTPNGERNESRALEKIAYALKFLAVDAGCTVLLLSQLTKDSAKENRQPKLSDLRGTSGLADASDLVLTGFRADLESNEVTWQLVKNRHGDVGSYRSEMDGVAQKFRF